MTKVAWVQNKLHMTSFHCALGRHPVSYVWQNPPLDEDGSLAPSCTRTPTILERACGASPEEVKEEDPLCGREKGRREVEAHGKP